MVPPVSDGLSPTASAQHRVAALYSAARDGVFRYLLALGLDAARAQEVTQDAFLRLYVALRDGAAIDDAKAWVYRVARNARIDSLDRNGRESPYSAAIAETIASFAKNPEQELIEKEWLEGFQLAIESLSPQFFRERIAFCVQSGHSAPPRTAGGPWHRLRKNDLEHNLTILSRLADFSALRLPIVVGVSRKSFWEH